MDTLVLLGGAVLALIWSYTTDRQQTLKALQSARRMFAATATEIIGILALIGLLLAWMPPQTIQNLLGSSNLLKTGLLGAAIGSVTILPAFVAFPLSASLLTGGANLMAVASFLTTLTMVGVATLPIEKRYFGWRFAVTRNLLSFGGALLVALGMVILL